MIILKNDNTETNIILEGYSYPFAREYWDSNWLSVNVKIIDFENDLNFDKNDNCILTTELSKLKNWFINIKDKNFNEISEINFIEPVISFKIKNKELKIVLKYELNPYYEKDADSEYSLIFKIGEKEIFNIIKALEYYMKKFPERYD